MEWRTTTSTSDGRPADVDARPPDVRRTSGERLPDFRWTSIERATHVRRTSVGRPTGIHAPVIGDVDIAAMPCSHVQAAAPIVALTNSILGL